MENKGEFGEQGEKERKKEGMFSDRLGDYLWSWEQEAHLTSLQTGQMKA